MSGSAILMKKPRVWKQYCIRPVLLFPLMKHMRSF